MGHGPCVLQLEAPVCAWSFNLPQSLEFMSGEATLLLFRNVEVHNTDFLTPGSGADSTLRQYEFTSCHLEEKLIIRSIAPTSFCKCTCFSNSTIIQLNGARSDDDGFTGGESKKAGTCNDCNRQFCIEYNLPICKGAKETDISTICFQRDSAKDEIIVFIFIFATVGLLIWAAIRPWVGRWYEVRSQSDVQSEYCIDIQTERKSTRDVWAYRWRRTTTIASATGNGVINDLFPSRYPLLLYSMLHRIIHPPNTPTPVTLC